MHWHAQLLSVLLLLSHRLFQVKHCIQCLPAYLVLLDLSHGQALLFPITGSAKHLRHRIRITLSFPFVLHCILSEISLSWLHAVSLHWWLAIHTFIPQMLLVLWVIMLVSLCVQLVGPSPNGGPNQRWFLLLKLMWILVYLLKLAITKKKSLISLAISSNVLGNASLSSSLKLYWKKIIILL